MKIISFATMKGGTGKTTCCFQLACCIARTSKVLVVDLDPQGNLSSNFRFDNFTEEEDVRSVADIFENFNTDPFDILIPEPLADCPHLDLLPSHMLLNGTEFLVMSRSCREQILSNYIKKYIGFFSEYDYILFDTGPNMGIINQNAFFVSDHIILVCDPDVNSAKGASLFMKLWEIARQYSSISDRVDALIVNNVERTKLTGKLDTYLKEHPLFKSITLMSRIPHTTRYKECTEQNVPIYLLSTKGKQEEESRQRAETAINNVMQELIERGIF